MEGGEGDGGDLRRFKFRSWSPIPEPGRPKESLRLVRRSVVTANREGVSASAKGVSTLFYFKGVGRLRS